MHNSKVQCTCNNTVTNISFGGSPRKENKMHHLPPLPSLLCNISIHLTTDQVLEWYSYSGCVLFVVLWFGFFLGGGLSLCRPNRSTVHKKKNHKPLVGPILEKSEI